MKAEEGFTLLESLVALSLIAMLLLTLFQIAGDGLAKSKKAEQAALAASAGRSLLSKVGIEIPILPGRTTGIINSLGHWELEIAERPKLEKMRSNVEPPLTSFNIRIKITMDNKVYDFSSVRSKPTRTGI
ncbi:MAG: hypothetical protein CMM58_03430 [Rhodospirillaceae bacterium]|nr:hypothetical protein [Rhodospirillaceae bacterium]|tara:strand:- start:2146 stop:2535 length:390 start_codon:yes stop_codon:yes gene_type:complete